MRFMNYYNDLDPKSIESISKHPLLPNICVPAERDLSPTTGGQVLQTTGGQVLQTTGGQVRFASTGSNLNPRNTQCMDACPAAFKRGG